MTGVIFDLDPTRVRNRPGIKWGRHGPEVLAAWVADMDVELPDVILDALHERISAGGLGYDFYDEPIPVIECFRERMADRFGWELSSDDVVRLQDVIQGLQWALETLTEPGEGVIVQTPIYPPFLSSISDLDRQVIPNPMQATGQRWELDLDQLDQVAARSDVTTLLLCHPHNPLGRAFGRPELEALAEIANRHDLVVISDEIHLDLVYEPHEHIPFASLGDDAAQRTVTLSAATKSFNMAGLRMAFLHTASSGLRDRLDAIAPRMIGGINMLGQVATIAGWTKGQAWLDELLIGLDHNRRLLGDLLATHLPDVVYRVPEATYLAWLDCSALGLGDDPMATFLERGRVALNSGLDFGPGGEGFVRINFATSPEMLEAVVERMAEAVR